jgi:SAM-dependent methyltransferase
MHGSLLDFGCGARPYQSLFPVESYVGLDIEESGHPAEGKRPDIYYDGKTIPLPDESQNHVFAAEVFEHVFNAPELYREIFRVLKPGGTLLMTCPFFWPLHEEPYDFARYTPYALQAELKKSGFSDVRVRRQGHGIEVIHQLALNYLHENLLPKNGKLRGALSLAYCTILNPSARVLARLLPDQGRMYLSNVTVATKSR